jgi:hypothetical protein
VPLAIRGHDITCRWDPRFGPDRERSGVLGVSRKLLPDLVSPDDVLTIYREADGRIRLS